MERAESRRPGLVRSVAAVLALLGYAVYALIAAAPSAAEHSVAVAPLGGAVAALALVLAGRALLTRLIADHEPTVRSLGTARRRAASVRTPRHRDPDAAGRPRPRAPSGYSLAA